MSPDNPACYECPNHRSRLHTWRRNEDGTAYCLSCKLKISKFYADEVFEDNSK